MFRRLTSATVVLLGLGLPIHAHSALLTLVNPSFETPILGDGSTNAAVAGWTIAGIGSGGAFNPNATQFTGGNVVDGNNSLYLNSGTTATQALADTLESFVAYTLSVWIGDRLDSNLPGFDVQLWAHATSAGAGGTLLTSGSLPPASVPNGGWSQLTLTYMSPGNYVDPLIGSSLHILLTSAGVQVNFDNITLDATTTLPEPSTTLSGALAACLLGAGWVRRKRDRLTPTNTPA